MYWDYIGIILGLYWDYIGIILGLYWGYIGIILGLYWDYIGIILGLYWDYIGIILGLYWDYIGIILGLYWDYIGIILGLYWDYIGIILGLYWDYIGIILGLYWGYIGVILGLYWDNGKENGNFYHGYYNGGLHADFALEVEVRVNGRAAKCRIACAAAGFPKPGMPQQTPHLVPLVVGSSGCSERVDWACRCESSCWHRGADKLRFSSQMQRGSAKTGVRVHGTYVS